MANEFHPEISTAIDLIGSQAALARKCGCVQQTISKMLLRQMPVSPEVAKRIEDATEGAVPRWKMRPDIWDCPSVPRPASQPQEAAE